jgi:hypothetical protein
MYPVYNESCLYVVDVCTQISATYCAAYAGHDICFEGS